MSAFKRCGRGLTEVPREVMKKKTIVELTLENNQISSVSDEICRTLSNLTHLNLRQNKLESFPEGISHFKKLKYLDLSRNPIGKIPEEVQYFRSTNKLTHLYLHDLQLKGFPSPILQFFKLEILDISNNKLGKLPASIEKLTNLTQLHISNCELTSLPSSIKNFKALTSLDASNNKIHEFQTHLCNAVTLQTLNLENNEITEVPNDVNNLAELTLLNLKQNRLTDLGVSALEGYESPESVCGLLGDTPQIQYLEKLRELVLSGNRLATAPNLGGLTQLKSLDLSNNKLTKGINHVTSVSKLTYLNLRQTETASLPNTMSKLVKLEHLDLGENNLASIDDVTSLPNLKTLYVDKNRLCSLPSDIAHLTSLELLSAENNPEIRQLPESMAELANLTHLFVGNTGIDSLPPEFATRLSNLTELDLEGNNMKEPPKKVCDLGVEAIRKHEAGQKIQMPSSVASLEVASLTQTEVGLNWKTPEGKFSHFDLSIESTEENIKQQVKVESKETHYRFSGLKPNTAYVATIAAIFDTLRSMDTVTVVQTLKGDNVRSRQQSVEKASEMKFQIRIVPTKQVRKSYMLPSGFMLKVPPRAIRDQLEVSVTCNPSHATQPKLRELEFYLSDIIDLSPHSMTFDLPVTLSRKCLDPGSNRVLVIMKSGDGQNWQEQSTIHDDVEISLSISQLGMFIAISRPYQDQCYIDKSAVTLKSVMCPDVAIEIPEDAVAERKLLALEVHVEENEKAGIHESSQSGFVPGPLVFVNRLQGESLVFSKPAIITIAEPPEIPGEDTELRIVKDEYHDGNWRDVTEQSSFTVENGIVRIETLSFSGFSVARVLRRIRTKVTEFFRAISRRLSCRNVCILLLQHETERNWFLVDLVETRNLNERIKEHRSRGYDTYHKKDVPYTCSFSMQVGDTIVNEVQCEGYMLTNTVNDHKYRPDEFNHWHIQVERAENDVRRANGTMIFYKKDSSGTEEEVQVLAELPFVIPEGDEETEEYESDDGVGDGSGGNGGTQQLQQQNQHQEEEEETREGKGADTSHADGEQQNVFTEEDIAEISKDSLSSFDKNRTLIRILKKKGLKNFEKFVAVLRKKNVYFAENVAQAYGERLRSCGNAATSLLRDGENPRNGLLVQDEEDHNHGDESEVREEDPQICRETEELAEAAVAAAAAEDEGGEITQSKEQSDRGLNMSGESYDKDTSETNASVGATVVEGEDSASTDDAASTDDGDDDNDGSGSYGYGAAETDAAAATASVSVTAAAVPAGGDDDDDDRILSEGTDQTLEEQPDRSLDISSGSDVTDKSDTSASVGVTVAEGRDSTANNDSAATDDGDDDNNGGDIYGNGAAETDDDDDDGGGGGGGGGDDDDRIKLERTDLALEMKQGERLQEGATTSNTHYEREDIDDENDIVIYVLNGTSVIKDEDQQ
ncbi:uncharacterized protein [Ptychodera flava]|uniref:uncharacterized protein n=1 Tax=Ptychodera flava TaxID=63121 RepID=UPI00396A882C